MSALSIGLFIVGDEILSGRRADQHMSQIIQILAERGLSLSWVQYIADKLEVQVKAYQTSAQTNDLVFSCGGIGATPDDHTRLAAATAFHRRLVRHPEAERLIIGRIQEMALEGKGTSNLQEQQNQMRLRMADLPENAGLIANPVNRFPGFFVERHYFVPGFPAMAWPMITSILDSEFKQFFHQNDHLEKSVIIYKISESEIIPLMERLEQQYPDLQTFSLPSLGNQTERAHIEFGLKGPSNIVSLLWEDTLQELQSLGAKFD